MHLIDQYAYCNRLRTVDPLQKAALAGVTIGLCLGLNRPLVNLLALGWMWALAACWAKLSGRTFGRVLLAEALFLGLSVIGVVVSLSFAPPTAQTWRWQLGPLWLSSSPAAIQTAWQLATRALAAASALNFLALTTPLVDLVDMLRRLHCPGLLIDLMTLIYRFIFVLLESLNRMYTAQDSRMGYTNFRRSMISAGLLGSQLFIDAYRGSQRLQIALESRGYETELRVLPSPYQSDRRVWWVGLGLTATLLFGWILT